MKKIFTFALLLSVFSIVSAQEQAPVANTDGTLTVTATVTYTSPYYYAVWLKNPDGTFLRTLMMYGSTSKYYTDMKNWYASTSNTANKVNATTGATKSSSGTYTSTWNGKDQANSAIVADGTYTVCVEMSSESYGTSSKFTSATFTKGTVAQNVTATTVSPISNITIKWAPNNTAIDEVKANQYSVYPNPTRSTVYVSGFDIKGIDVMTLNGKYIFSTNNQRMDLSALPKGMYLAKLTTNAGVFFKKIEKL